MKVIDVPLFDLLPPAIPLRQFADDEKMAELVESIQKDGLLQPLIVAQEGDKYRIIAGHRRYIACKHLEMSTVPCSVVEADAKQAVTLSLQENLKREDLSPVDMGYYFLSLWKEHGLTQREIAEAIGCTAAHVSHLVSLTKLPEHLQQAVRRGELAYMAALHFGKIEDKDTQEYYTRIAIDHGASEPVVRQWVSDIIKKDWKRPEPVEGVDETPLPPSVERPGWYCIWCDRSEGEVLLEKVWLCRECIRALTKAKEEGE